jgi:hypothetical protein
MRITRFATRTHEPRLLYLEIGRSKCGMCVECGLIKCFSTGGMMMIMISSGKLIASLLQYNSLLFGQCETERLDWTAG